MAHPAIQSGTQKPDLNPVALLQAAPPASDSGAGFEAALDRARQAERPQQPAPRQSSGPQDGPPQARTDDAPKTQDKAPEAAPKSPANEATRPTERTTRDASARQDAPAEENTDAASDTAEPAPTAGLPAEIAAILAALATVRDKPVTDVDARGAPDLKGSRIALGVAELLAGAGDGEGKSGTDAALRFAALMGKGQEAAAALRADTDERAAQTLALNSQTGTTVTRAGVDALLGTARGEAAAVSAQPAHAVALPLAARVETPQAAQPVPQLPMTTPAGQRGWAAEVGSQVAWMLGRNESRAELQLSPPSLGKLGVSIHVNGDQTTAHFVASTQAARDALEQAMPRLREVLEQAGINLGQTSVGTSGEHAGRDGDGNGSRRSGVGLAGHGGDEAAPVAAAASTWVRGGNGVIDTFA